MAIATGTLQNFIDGEQVSSSAETEPILNPATGEELARAPLSSPDEVDRAVQAARRASSATSRGTHAGRPARHYRRPRGLTGGHARAPRRSRG